MAKITLPNGLTVEGSDEFIRDIIARNEDGVHYNSSTQGLIRIDTMATPHIINAVSKLMRQALERVSKSPRKDFVAAVEKGIGADSITVLAMVRELQRRKD